MVTCFSVHGHFADCPKISTMNLTVLRWLNQDLHKDARTSCEYMGKMF